MLSGEKSWRKIICTVCHTFGRFYPRLYTVWSFFHAHRGKNSENTAKTRKIRSWNGQIDFFMAGFFAFQGKNTRKMLVLIWPFFVQQRKFASTRLRDLNYYVVLFVNFSSAKTYRLRGSEQI